ncbi:hypothetical protein [Hyphomonas sp.]|uniref:hypothetical protein n=1 Tax=Hyphomonas sp. TaxID=87 RepID=UPI003F71FA84
MVDRSVPHDPVSDELVRAIREQDTKMLAFLMLHAARTKSIRDDQDEMAGRRRISSRATRD